MSAFSDIIFSVFSIFCIYLSHLPSSFRIPFSPPHPHSSPLPSLPKLSHHLRAQSHPPLRLLHRPRLRPLDPYPYRRPQRPHLPSFLPLTHRPPLSRPAQARRTRQHGPRFLDRVSHRRRGDEAQSHERTRRREVLVSRASRRWTRPLRLFPRLKLTRVWLEQSLVFVHPDFQRTGVAQALVKVGTDWADRDGLPCYLTSSPSVRCVSAFLFSLHAWSRLTDILFGLPRRQGEFVYRKAGFVQQGTCEMEVGAGNGDERKTVRWPAMVREPIKAGEED